MKWRSRGPREDWAADEDASNEGFNPGATSPPCLFHPRLPISLSLSCSFSPLFSYYLLLSLALHKAKGVNSMSKCNTVLQYVALCVCERHWIFDVCVRLCDSREMGRWGRFFGSGLFVATKHDGPHRGLNRLNPLTLKEVLCL